MIDTLVELLYMHMTSIWTIWIMHLLC